jgi:hypothetical protein
MSAAEYPVFIKRGDARAEVDQLLAELRAAHGDDTGFHKYLFVTRAEQTVVMLTDREGPLAEALRGRRGWSEPGE